MNAPRRSPARTRILGSKGVTLAELMVVLVLIALIASMGFPRMEAWVRSLSQRSAANQIVADLAYARALAAREGETVSFRVVDWSVYQITVDPAVGASRQVRRVDLRRVNRQTKFSVNTARIAFDSRGILRAQVSTADSVRVIRGTSSETIRVSSVGRPYRAR